ncbi:MAG: UDP-N-acetylmuramoyl-L-alanyl-D-glutamate--2,6-diaminopimelate ligase [Bdellovibrionales bacterium]|nr:UDP-N-acetylmuramoyl-L-alanyl-D-glutamate--2,6-diaminopimelate ligase [Bdellovibrionales bacterium]
MRIRDIQSKFPHWQLGSCDLDSQISFISRDSKRVDSNCVFVAIKGNSWDGHSFIEEALQKKVQLVIAEKYAGTHPKVVVVENARKVYAELNTLFYNTPSKNLFTVGITGTNGKTTTSFMVEKILNSIGLNCGVIGTIDHHLKDKVWPTSLTSPGAEELQSRLCDFTAAGAKAVVMEVSSHSLDQYRIDGTEFDAAIFTNLTQDHLDYHHTMENYFLAKKRLFSEVLKNSTKKKPIAIVNADDPYAKNITSQSLYSFGRTAGDIRFNVDHMDFTGTSLKVIEGNKKFAVKLSAVGLHNAYNAIAASLVTKSLNMDLEETLNVLSHTPSVSGRLEKISNTKGRHVFVDFAHTPDALERALVFLRDIQSEQKIAGQKLTVIFGAGGNRDTSKRPIMGEIASRLADQVYVTSDNPRFEDPEKIVKDILVGCKDAVDLHSIVNRKEAIFAALKNSKEDDIVLIAGKGHETYQDIAGVKHFFSDQECVKDYFK